MINGNEIWPFYAVATITDYDGRFVLISIRPPLQFGNIRIILVQFLCVTCGIIFITFKKCDVEKLATSTNNILGLVILRDNRCMSVTKKQILFQ